MYPDALRCRLCEGYARVGEADDFRYRECSCEPGDLTGYCKTMGLCWDAEVRRDRVCLAHLPPDDDGWNDATRARYEREYGTTPPCTCEQTPAPP